MRYALITGLTRGQLRELAARVAVVAWDITRPGGRPAPIGLKLPAVIGCRTLHRSRLEALLRWPIVGGRRLVG